ncbi:MAG: hypothetical protein MRY59_09730 [Aquisalinus sp.]|nr:hypothetical protein [Aquisalinus sp.]
MSENKKNGANMVAIIVLTLIGTANIGYGLWRMTQGEELAPPLFIAATMCFLLAAVLRMRSV